MQSMVAEVAAVSVRHKVGSKPYRDELRASLLALGASGVRLTELIARDLQQHGIRPRRAWRDAAELSQREAAERFNLLAGNPRATMTGNRIWDFERWPDGGVRPTLTTLKLLAGTYGTTLDQLVDTHDLVHMPETDRIEYLEISRAPARPVPVPVAYAPPRSSSRDDLVAEVADESAEFGEWAGMSEVADAAIEQYQSQAQRLARDFDLGMPVLPLLLDTRRLRNRVTSRLRGHTRLDQARDLYLLAAQVCGLLAWQTGNLGNYRAADTHAWTAWMCAEQSAHDGARAWVRATQSKLAYGDGRYTEATQFAEDGLNYSTDDSARVFLALFLARALARTGRPDDARHALELADTEQTRSPAADLLGGTWAMTADRYYSNTAEIHVMLEAPDRALTEAEQAIRLTEGTPPAERRIWTSVYARIHSAHAYLQQSNLDGAVAALRPVLDLPPDIRNDPILQNLARLRQMLALPAYADAAIARDIQDEIEAYRSDALPRQITA